MNTKGWMVVVAGIVIIALAIVLVWPSDPLAGVETVAIAGPAGKDSGIASQVLGGLEIALNERSIRTVANDSEADAVITIEPREADIHINEQGFYARVRCLVTRADGRQQMMYLYLTADEQGFTAKLESRRFWELWK